MKIITRIDPYLQMGGDSVDDLNDFFWENDVDKFVVSSYEHWAGMVSTDPAEPYDLPFGTKVGLYADNPADPSVYYLTFVYPDSYCVEHFAKYGKPYVQYQCDMFFVIRDDVNGPHSDISEINGSQCRDCGRVNVTSEYNDKHNLTVPVWRQAADGAHTLCDNCGDMDYMRLWCGRRGYSWDDQGPIETEADAEWNDPAKRMVL